MANVTMDLNELKALEDKIKGLEKEKQDLIDREQQVVIYHKYFNGKIVPKNVERRNGSFRVIGIETTYNDLRSRHYSEPITSCHRQFDCSFQELLDRGYIEIDVTELTEKTTKDYKNLSEVIKLIRNEEELQVADKLQKAIDRANAVEVASETLIEDHAKEIIRIKKETSDRIEKLDTEIAELIKKYDNIIIDINKAKDVEIFNLKQELEDLKNDKKRISLEDQVKELTKKLKEMENKNLMQRIFKS